MSERDGWGEYARLADTYAAAVECAGGPLRKMHLRDARAALDAWVKAHCTPARADARRAPDPHHDGFSEWMFRFTGCITAPIAEPRRGADQFGPHTDAGRCYVGLLDLDATSRRTCTGNRRRDER